MQVSGSAPVGEWSEVGVRGAGPPLPQDPFRVPPRPVLCVYMDVLDRWIDVYMDLPDRWIDLLNIEMDLLDRWQDERTSVLIGRLILI